MNVITPRRIELTRQLAAIDQRISAVESTLLELRSDPQVIELALESLRDLRRSAELIVIDLRSIVDD